jgi:hypothetical protein
MGLLNVGVTLNAGVIQWKKCVHLSFRTTGGAVDERLSVTPAGDMSLFSRMERPCEMFLVTRGGEQVLRGMHSSYGFWVLVWGF